MLLELSTVLFDIRDTHHFAERLSDELHRDYEEADRNDSDVNLAALSALFLMCAYGEIFGMNEREIEKRVAKKLAVVNTHPGDTAR